MNKPFYGVATMPKSARGIPITIQQKSSIDKIYQDPEPMIPIKKKIIMDSPNGGNSSVIQPQKKN